MKKKKAKGAVRSRAQSLPENTSEKGYTDIHKKASGLPESLAEDLCEAISDVKERAEERRESDNAGNGLSVRSIVIIVIIGIVVYWALDHIRAIAGIFGFLTDAISPILAGSAIAFILNLVLIPIERLWNFAFGKTPEKIKNIASRFRRPVCLIASTLIMFGLISGIFLIIIPEIVVTVKLFIDMLPTLAGNVEELFTEFSDFLSKYDLKLPALKINTGEAMDILNSFLSQRGQQMLDTTVNFTASLFSTVFDTVLSLVFAFYVLAQKEKLSLKIKRVLYALTSEEKADTIISIATLSNSAFTKFVTGQFAEAVIIGVLCYIGMLIFDMPYAAVISVVIGATALIPIFGAFIGAAIGALLILAVDFYTAVWFIVFIIVLQQIETNLIYPRVVGKSIGLPGILVLAAVTIGGAMFGFMGIILGVPVCSVFYCIFNEFIAMRIKNKGEHLEKKAKIK